MVFYREGMAREGMAVVIGELIILPPPYVLVTMATRRQGMAREVETEFAWCGACSEAACLTQLGGASCSSSPLARQPVITCPQPHLPLELTSRGCEEPDPVCPSGDAPPTRAAARRELEGQVPERVAAHLNKAYSVRHGPLCCCPHVARSSLPRPPRPALTLLPPRASGSPSRLALLPPSFPRPCPSAPLQPSAHSQASALLCSAPSQPVWRPPCAIEGRCCFPCSPSMAREEGQATAHGSSIALRMKQPQWEKHVSKDRAG